MAKISITVDTETNEIDVNINGETFIDVTDVSIYKYMDYDGDPDIRCNISSSLKQDGLTKTTTVYASDSNSGITKAQQDIVNMFKPRGA